MTIHSDCRLVKRVHDISIATRARGKLRPVAFLLDSVATGLPKCLRAVAAAEMALLASRDLVDYQELTLLVPHRVSINLLEQQTVNIYTDSKNISHPQANR